jgi:general stress protein CsbA
MQAYDINKLDESSLSNRSRSGSLYVLYKQQYYLAWILHQVAVFLRYKREQANSSFICFADVLSRVFAETYNIFAYNRQLTLGTEFN